MRRDGARARAIATVRRREAIIGIIAAAGVTIGLAGASALQDVATRPVADAAIVRVDVYPTSADGHAVGDLTAADFEVFEDGVPQTVDAIERVALGNPPSAVPAPKAPSNGPATLAPGDRSRIVVVFLDTYHSDLAGVRAMAPSVERLLDAALGPDDVIAVMTPEMSVRDVKFMQKTAGVSTALTPVREWASHEPSRLRDPDEQRYALCFPDDGAGGCPDVVGPGQNGPLRTFAAYPGVAAEMAERRHGQRTVQALSDLARTLRVVNEGRKAILLLSGGWSLFRENLALARMVRCGAAEQRTANDDDRPRPSRREGMADVADQTICDADRRRLAELDLQSEFQRTLDRLNTANASVYPVEMGRAQPGGRSGVPSAAPSATLRQLADQTDGAAIADLNDRTGGVDRLVGDISSYYLVSYRSTNRKADGAFRRVDVRVKRRGVEVRGRRGYRAGTAGEIERQRTEAALAGQTIAGELGAVPAALAGLQQVRATMPVRTRVAYATAGAGRIRLWAVAEIDTAISREGPWLGGGTVDAALSGSDNRALASAEGALAGGQRTVLLDLGQVEVPETGTSLRVQLQPAGEGPALKDVVSLAPIGLAGDPGVPLLLRRGPTTGTRYVPTADPQFRRTERVRVELPRATAPGTVTASLLDRAGTPMALPVTTATRADGAVTWASAEVSLAPLAHGDYVIKMTVDGVNAVTAIRVVP